MKCLKRLWPLGLALGLVAGVPFWFSQRRVLFYSGVYRYPHVDEPLPHSSIDAAFVSWVDPKAPQQIISLLDQARARKSLALITLEPFPDPSLPRSDRSLLRDVIEGRYNRHIKAVFEPLCAQERPVLLRFAHEMDNAGQYPWSVGNGEDYIRFYRSVWAQARQPRCRHLHWVWSPAGNDHSASFWPGSDAVDLIGISVYSSPRWSPDGQLRDFAQVYEQRRWLYRRFRKPMLVAEMGVSGADEGRRRWLIDARHAIRHYPELLGWVYFSAPQPTWISLPEGHEDWSLPPTLLHLITVAKSSQSFHCRLLHASLFVLHQEFCQPRPAGPA